MQITRNALVFLFLLFNCLASSEALAIDNTNTINKVIVFGDSLSDNRNFYELTQCYMPYSPYENGQYKVYYDGRFTNGLVWAEHLGQSLGIDIGNTIEENNPSSTCPKRIKSDTFPDYAYAGTWASDDIPEGSLGLVSLSWEINEYINSKSNHGDNNQHELIVMWIGANDYLDGRTKETLEEATNKTVGAIEHALEQLIQDGNRNILVLNLPDLGLTPVVMSAGKDMSARISLLSSTHNKKLAAVIKKLQLRYKASANLMAFNTSEYFTDVMAHPAKYNLSNITEPCYTGDYASLSDDETAENKTVADTVCRNPDNYLYWDHTHPSAAIHRILAGLVKDFLKEQNLVV